MLHKTVYIEDQKKLLIDQLIFKIRVLVSILNVSTFQNCCSTILVQAQINQNDMFNTDKFQTHSLSVERRMYRESRHKRNSVPSIARLEMIFYERIENLEVRVILFIHIQQKISRC